MTLQQRLATLVCIGVATTICGAYELSLDWQASRDFLLDSDGGDLVIDDGLGNVITIGATHLFAGGEDILMIKYEPTGVEQWAVVYNGVIPDSYDVPVDAVSDGNGNFYLVAQTASIDSPTFTSEWVTMKVNAAGLIVWERRFRGTGTFGSALPRDIDLGPNGEIAVTGWVRGDDSFTDFGIAVYEPDGTERFATQFTSPGARADSGDAVAFAPDGSVVIGGQYNTGSQRIVGVLKYDVAGNFLWSETYDASALFDLEDRVYSVKVAADGSIYVGADGINSGNEGRDFVLLKYDPAGVLVWDRRVTAGGSNIAPTVLLGPDETIYMSGPSDGAYRLVAFDSGGLQQWTETYPGAVFSDSTRDHAVIDQQGNVAILLYTVPTPGITAFTIVRYASDSTLVDETTLDPHGVSRFPTGLATVGVDRLAATGRWSPNGHRDVLTVQLALPESHLLGDLNCDGLVSVGDIGPFVLALTDSAGYVAQFPDCNLNNGDINEDAIVSVGDIGAFVALLTGG
ncbi:MAG: hypothetical protein AB7N71_10165 [Phycisphaerae bacterium]